MTVEEADKLRKQVSELRVELEEIREKLRDIMTALSREYSIYYRKDQP